MTQTAKKNNVITLVPRAARTPAAPAKPKTAAEKFRLPPNFYLRGDHIWIGIKVPDRKKRLRVPTGFTTATAASLANGIKRGMEIIGEEREKLYGYKKRPEMPTLREYFADYKTGYLAEPRSSDDITKYINRYEAFVARFGDKDLDAITSDDCVEWIKIRKQTKTRFKRAYSHGTIRVECEGLKTFFERAIGKDKPLVTNPWKGVTLPPASLRERILESDELHLLFSNLKPEAQRYAYLVANSGLRRREYWGLRSCEVLDYKLTIKVSVETAKGHKERNVPITPTILALIKQQRAHRGLTAGSTERLWPYFSGWLNREITKTAKRLGLERVTGHDVRRTWATELCESVPLKALSDLLGHAGTQVTTRVYTIAKKRKVAQQIQAGPTLFAPADPV